MSTLFCANLPIRRIIPPLLGWQKGREKPGAASNKIFPRKDSSAITSDKLYYCEQLKIKYLKKKNAKPILMHFKNYRNRVNTVF